MNKRTLAATLALSAALAASAACGDNDNHGNANHSNANTARPANANAAAANANTAARNLDWNINKADFDKKKDEYANEAKRLGNKIGSGASDAWIWTKMKGKLAAIDDFPDTGVNVDVDNGQVTLSGTVTGQQKTQAAAAFNDMKKDDKDVKGLTNNLTVAASPAR